ncbi:Glutathione S-transferase P [Balamuthia mandrillaris]
MEKNKLRLTYFGARGSCDKVRLLMAIAGLNYQEVIVTGREFGRMSGEVEFGKLPLLEDGDLRLVHSCAIMRHLARKADLYGSDAREAALCDMWMEQCEEVQQALWKAEFITQDVSDFRAEAMKSQFLQDCLIPEFTHMSKLMAKNDTMFLVGNKVQVQLGEHKRFR